LDCELRSTVTMIARGGWENDTAIERNKSVRKRANIPSSKDGHLLPTSRWPTNRENLTRPSDYVRKKNADGEKESPFVGMKCVQRRSTSAGCEWKL
jgi:hypothetical protein